MFTKKDRKIRNQAAMIINRNKVIYKLLDQKNILSRENNILQNKNKKQQELIIRITNLLEANKYNNEKATLNKIKELVHDYQSTN